MTQSLFIKMLEEYYGRYERISVKKIVTKYISNMSELFLDKLYQKLITKYSGEYKYTPDVAILEKYRQDILRDGEWENQIPMIENKPDEREMETVGNMLSVLVNKLRMKKS